MNLDEIARLAGSTEELLSGHMQRLGEAYTSLVNAPDAATGATALKELRASASDLERNIREVLTNWNSPPATLILNVNERALTNWNADSLSALYVNFAHYFQRFLYARNKPNKIRDLTSLYYLAKDLVECCEATKSGEYRGCNPLNA